MVRISPRFSAIIQAIFVTFLWSTSWVLIKQNISDIPPLTFAGLRYSIAFIILLPGMLRYKDEVKNLKCKEWVSLIILGLVFYTLTQGGQFVTLKYLDAVPFSLLLNFTSVLVAVLGLWFLKEIPSRLQWIGTIIFIIGVVIYFSPAAIQGGDLIGYMLAGITVCANAAAAVLGRSVNRGGKISPIVVTVISMGVGAIILMVAGLVIDGFPSISMAGWGIITWLAVVNTALAFTLWNKTLQELSAVESSIINNTMLVQIAVLAWIFLGERITFTGMIGLVIAATGVLLVNLRRE